jgi:hypothetical protein
MIPPAGADRIAIVQRTRAAGAEALASTFSAPGPAPSELSLAERWLAEMRRSPRLLTDGWYQPPPHGLSVLIGQPNSYERLTYNSLRDPGIWPKDNNRLLPESLIYVYASPTDRVSALIGDIGATLYSGTDAAIRDHLSCCLHVSTQVALYAQVGMELRELFHHAQKLISDISADLNNYVTSITDSGASNIGHTVPWTYEDYDADDIHCIESSDVTKIADLIRQRRVFLNASSRLLIQPNMAFTVEPRIVSASLPLCGYHLIVTFLDGQKTICSGFNQIFKIFGMDQYLPHDALAHLYRLGAN